MSELKERLKAIAQEKGLSIRSFERKSSLSVGFVNASKKTLNQKSAENILRAFPDLNQEWLLTGEGSMLKDVDDNNTVVDTSQADLLEALKKSQEQIDRLLGIIERMQSL